VGTAAAAILSGMNHWSGVSTVTMGVRLIVLVCADDKLAIE
jgi:hypothetical protein